MTKMEQEIWVPVKTYEHQYEVSSHGRVRSFTGRTSNNDGILLHKKTRYSRVNLCGKWLSVHRLVADHFIPNPKNKPCVNHKDGNKKNNHVSNLEWCTYSENIKHGFDTGLLKAWNKGIKTMTDVTCAFCNKVFYPDKNGRRFCSHSCATKHRYRFQNQENGVI